MAENAGKWEHLGLKDETQRRRRRLRRVVDCENKEEVQEIGEPEGERQECAHFLPRDSKVRVALVFHLSVLLSGSYARRCRAHRVE